MKKILIISLLLLTTACASKSDIVSLQTEIDALKNSQTSLSKEVAACKEQMVVLTENQTKCVSHCKTLESKLDKVFKKAQYK